MNIKTENITYTDPERNESIEGILKIGNSGAPSISDLSPISDWKGFPQSCYNSCYGLPYQDHNYGAPPPHTPSPGPGNTAIVAKKKFEVALKSLKPNKAVVDRKGKAPPKKQNAIRKRNTKSTVVKPPVNEPQTVSVVSEQIETVGEAAASGDYSDSVTRCICSFTHDDGYMICCDQCQVWQHIDCMGIDRTNIPEEYSCEKCMPRKVHKMRARLIQKKKKDELLRSSTSSEDENANAKKPPNILKLSRKNPRTKFGTQRNKKIHQGRLKNGTVLPRNKKSVMKTAVTGSMLQNKRASKGRNDAMEVSVDGDSEESPWTVPYETGTNNQYSTDIQESLKSYRPNGTYQLESVLCELDVPRCQLRLLVSGRRGLEVESDTRRDQALIEFKGKVMLQQQFEQENNFVKRPQPFVLFYDKWDGLQVCVDATSFGNEARFVRRSCAPNAEVRHVIENGQVHLVLFSIMEISSGSEVTIPFDFDFKSCEYCVECACITSQCPVRKAGRKFKKSISQASGDHIKTQTTQSKLAHKQSHTPIKKEVHEELNVQIPTDNSAIQETNAKPQVTTKAAGDGIKSPNSERAAAEETRRLSREDRKIEAYMKAFEEMEKKEVRRREALQRINEKKESPDVQGGVMGETVKVISPTQTSPSKPPTKPPTITKSGAKPTVAAKPPAAAVKSTPNTRPAPRRRRNRSGPAPRRRASSSGAAPATSQPALEVKAEVTSEVSRLEEGATPDTAPTSRIPAPAEVGSTHAGTVISTAAASSALSFRFPKTKKQILCDWYQEKGMMDKSSIEKPLTVSISQDDSIDFVKTNSSPGSSWAHMRRNSMSTNVQSTHTHATPAIPVVSCRKLDTSMGSAKKRWLKQAMEEDSNQSNLLTSPTNEQSSPPNATLTSSTAHAASTYNDAATSPGGTPLPSLNRSAVDFVTPLKKRRLARESISLDSHPTSPENSQHSSTPSVTLNSTYLTSEEAGNHVNTMSSDSDSIPSPTKRQKPSDISGDISQGEPWQLSEQQQLQVTDDGVDNVPATVRAVSPIMISNPFTSDIPTTVIDVVNAEPVTSPLKKYKLKQQKIAASANSTASDSVMLSPRQPRTLGDLMQKQPQQHSPMAEVEALETLNSPTKSFNGGLFTSPVGAHTIVSPDHGSNSLLTQTPIKENYATPNKCVEDGLRSSPAADSHGTDNTSFHAGNDTWHAVRRLNLNQQNELKRSVSLMEGTEQYHHCNGDEDCGTLPVHKSIKKELCGDKEYAPITPPQKKKVSLLEYRKRMQFHAPKSDSCASVSAPTTPLLSSIDTASTVKQLMPIGLPLLPMFEEMKDPLAAVAAPQFPQPKVMKRPPISLDERLKLEFGFVSKLEPTEDTSDDENRDTPPPPPPPISPPKNSQPVLDTQMIMHKTEAEPLSNGVYSDDGAAVAGKEVASAVLENGYLNTQSSNVDQTATDYSTDCSLVALPRQINSTGSLSPPPPVKKFPLKQGSLGAVMLGQPALSPLSNRDISGSRQIATLNLPKKYR